MAKKKRNGFTWAQAWRDIVVAAIYKGQLLALGLMLAVLLLILRLPPEDLSKFANALADLVEHHEIIELIMFILTLTGWISHTRYMRKQFSKEYERIGREKSELQSRLAGNKFDSSDE